MDQVLEAVTGRELGSRPSGRLRRSGHVPGVLYGQGLEPVNLAVDWPALRRALTSGGGMATPVRLRVSGKEHLTIIKELQRHPVRRDVLHVDFLAVDPDAPITVDVPLVITGLDALGASDVDKVVLVLHSLQVTAKPNALPAEIEVDVSHIADEGTPDEIRVHDLTLPAGVTTDTEGDVIVANLAEPQLLLEEEPEVAEGEEAEGAEGEAAAEGEGAAEGQGAGEAAAGEEG
jgi:large subunit ribosomal protein L25